MHTLKKFWFVLVGAVLGMVILACSCGSMLPKLPGVTTPTSAAPASAAPVATLAPLPTLAHPPTIAPLPTSATQPTSESFPTDTPGTTGTGDLATKPPPSALDSLPYSDDFSNASSGWDIFNQPDGQAGYINGTYFVISKAKGTTLFGAANKYYADTVIEVDATPVNGPADFNFSYEVGCRSQANFDGYIFEVGADGSYAVGYYSNSGSDFVSLLPGGDWDYSDAIQQGMVTNHIQVTCNGSQLILEVNRTLLFQTQDSTFSAGDISLGAATYADDNTPAEVHFDNLMVNKP